MQEHITLDPSHVELGLKLFRRARAREFIVRSFEIKDVCFFYAGDVACDVMLRSRLLPSENPGYLSLLTQAISMNLEPGEEVAILNKRKAGYGKIANGTSQELDLQG